MKTIIDELNAQPHLPPVEDLAFRSFRGEADFPAMLAVIHASKEVDGRERAETLADIARNYATLDNCDPSTDMIVAEIQGQLVGYSRVWWNRDDEGQWLGWAVGYLLPAWRHQGIGHAMLAFCERRLKQIAGEQFQAGQLAKQTPCLYSTEVFDSEKDFLSLLKNAGYSEARHEHLMVRPNLENIPAAPMPEGLEVRPIGPEHLQAVWRADLEAFQDHWGYIPPTEKNYQDWVNDPLTIPNLWQVGWDGDQVAGMVLNYINVNENQIYHRKRGYTEGISVRRPWRRRGLARALLVRSLHMLKELGMEEAALSVDSQNLNMAYQLYQDVGFQIVGGYSIYRKGFTLRSSLPAE